MDDITGYVLKKNHQISNIHYNLLYEYHNIGIIININIIIIKMVSKMDINNVIVFL